MGLLDMLGAAAAQNAASSNAQAQQQQQWQQYPGMHIPITNVPAQSIYYGPRHPSLSDFDIELMAACITNHHPVIDGQTHCFCMLKRLERGISKD